MQGGSDMVGKKVELVLQTERTEEKAVGGTQRFWFLACHRTVQFSVRSLEGAGDRQLRGENKNCKCEGVGLCVVLTLEKGRQVEDWE